MAGKWMSEAFSKHKGALRATAKRMGLVKGDQPLTASDLNKLYAKAKSSGNTTLMRRVNLARRGMEAKH